MAVCEPGQVRAIALLIAAATCCSACSSVPQRPYPSDWPVPIPADRPEALVGTYVDPGHDDTEPPQPHSLAYSLVGAGEEGADRFSLAVAADGRLEVVACKGSERLASVVCPWAARNGWVVVERSWSSSSSPGLLVQSDRWLLAKATDGSLIAESDYSAGGLFFVVPISDRIRTWVRFTPIDSGP